MRTPLSKDTKAVLRELRRHHRTIEEELHRIGDVLVEVEYAIATYLGEDTIRKASIARVRKTGTIVDQAGNVVEPDEDLERGDPYEGRP